MFPNSLSCEHDGALPEQITSFKKTCLFVIAMERPNKHGSRVQVLGYLSPGADYFPIPRNNFPPFLTPRELFILYFYLFI